MQDYSDEYEPLLMTFVGDLGLEQTTKNIYLTIEIYFVKENYKKHTLNRKVKLVGGEVLVQADIKIFQLMPRVDRV